MQEKFQFDREKFKDVVHYVIDYVCNKYGAAALGNTKLHKALYYSDMLHYLASGNPLTGADYQRQRFGPTARHLTQALRDLQSERRITLDTVNYYGFSKSEYHPLRAPDRSRLKDSDISLIEEVAGFVCARTAVEISEFSHDEVWESVPMGERIPYYAAFAMFPTEITDEDVERAADEAVRIAPLIEAEQREGRIY